MGESSTHTVTIQEQVTPATPEVSISRGRGVTEGGNATFTLTASPAPAAALTVDVAVTESGGYATAGTRQVTVPTGGTATFTVATVDDGADEPDGSVTATVTAGSGYTVSSSQGTATVAVTDNDDPLLTASFETPPPNTTARRRSRSSCASARHWGRRGRRRPWRRSRYLGQGEAGAAGRVGSVACAHQTEVVARRRGDARRRPGVRETGAVCAADGRALSNTASATVGGPARLRVKGASGREGKDASLDFAVTLSRGAAHTVSVDYATVDGTAVAGADYTATSGTLTFASGETAKTVTVPILDDAIDEGKEKFTLRLSNPQGAFLRTNHREATGTIRNEDPLQAMWLSRFGRMVASDAVEAVTARLETPRGAGSHLTLAGQRLDLARADDGQALADAVAGLARRVRRGGGAGGGRRPVGRHGPAMLGTTPPPRPSAR